MRLKLVRRKRGSELIQFLEDRYGSLPELERRIKKDPENFLYQLDLEKWQYHLDNPKAVVEERETIIIRDPEIDLCDLKLLEVIKKQNPTSLVNLSSMLNQGLEELQPRVQRLAQEGLLKLIAGPEGDEIPLVDFNMIEIEI